MTVKQAGRIGDPIDLAILKAQGEIRDFEPASDFDPAGSGSADFHILTSSGTWNRLLPPIGLLRLRRETAGDSFMLEVERYLRNETDRLHVATASIRCRADALASPVEWRMTSVFEDPEGGETPGLTERISGRAEAGAYEIRSDSRTVSGRADPALATNWGLFEAVQRLPFGDAAEHRFMLLEGTDLVKPDQRLRYRGRFDYSADSGAVPVHCFQHLGRGVMPTDYWLDETHRLLAVINSGRAYVRAEMAIQALPGPLARFQAAEPAKEPSTPPRVSFRAEDLADRLADGAPVTDWPGGNGIVLTVPDVQLPNGRPAGPPTFVRDAGNGCVAVRFDGDDDLLAAGGLANRHLAGRGFTIAMATRSDGGEFGFGGNQLSSAAGVPRLYGLRGRFTYDEAHTSATIPTRNGRLEATVFLHDGRETIRAWLNGAPVGERAGVPAVKAFDHGNLVFPFWMKDICRRGDLFELTIYDRVLSEDEVRGLMRLMMDRYGIETEPGRKGTR